MRNEGRPVLFVARAVRAGRRASTLIELLVVIAVVGFLTALLLPSLKRTTDLAAATICRHNLREIGLGLQMYRYENDGWLPTPDPVNATAAAAAEERDPWFGKLCPTYLPDPGVLRCPRDPFGGRTATALAHAPGSVSAGFASYGINNFILTAGGGRLAQVDRLAPKRSLDTILAADLGPDSGDLSSRNDPSGSMPRRDDSVLSWGDGFDPFSSRPVSTWLTTRHGQGIHMLTLAGGIRDVRTVELLRSPIARSYPSCAAGGCTLCRDFRIFHYSFAKDQLFWWTGPIPSE